MGVKGAKRSVKMLAMYFYNSFFKNILLLINGGLSKVRSLYTYVLKGFILVVLTVYTIPESKIFWPWMSEN